MILLGDDFFGENFIGVFMNIEALMLKFNEQYGKEYVLEYSTPSRYLGMVKKFQENEQFSGFDVKYGGDFFPYSFTNDKYWTGYYSTRPNIKKQVKDFQSDIFTAMQLSSYKVIDRYNNNSQIFETRDKFFDVMGIAVHHDSITGTSTSEVS